MKSFWMRELRKRRLWLLLGLAAVILGAAMFGGGGGKAMKAVSVMEAVSGMVGRPTESAWRTKVEPHLDRLDQAAAGVAEKHLSRIPAFFAEKKRGAKAFADWAYSWTAKYQLVRGKFQGDGGDGFRQWLQQKFEETVFRQDELQELIASVVEGYVAESRGLENDTLVRISADIAQDDLFQGSLPQGQTDAAFQNEYRRLTEDVLPSVLNELQVSGAGLVANFALAKLRYGRWGRGWSGGWEFRAARGAGLHDPASISASASWHAGLSTKSLTGYATCSATDRRRIWRQVWSNP